MIGVKMLKGKWSKTVEIEDVTKTSDGLVVNLKNGNSYFISNKQNINNKEIKKGDSLSIKIDEYGSLIGMRKYPNPENGNPTIYELDENGNIAGHIENNKSSKFENKRIVEKIYKTRENKPTLQSKFCFEIRMMNGEKIYVLEDFIKNNDSESSLSEDYLQKFKMNLDLLLSKSHLGFVIAEEASASGIKKLTSFAINQISSVRYGTWDETREWFEPLTI